VSKVAEVVYCNEVHASFRCVICLRLVYLLFF